MDLPGLPAKEEGIRVRHRLEKVSADVVVPIWPRPASVLESALRIFFLAARCLDYTVERHEFSTYELSHVFYITKVQDFEALRMVRYAAV